MEKTYEEINAPIDDQSYLNPLFDDFDETLIKYVKYVGDRKYSRVNKVHHTGLNCAMAHKVMECEVHRRCYISDWFVDMKKCSSPFLVEIYKANSDFMKITSYMEFMDGLSTDDLIKRTNRVPEQMLGKMVVPIMNGLKYLHEDMKMIHGNLKPTNILFNTKGEVKLSDFGFARLMYDFEMVATYPSQHYYEPPEFWDFDDPAEQTMSSDIWALGLIMVELAIGRYPYPYPAEDEIKETFLIDPKADRPRDYNRSFSKGYVRHELTRLIEAATPKLPPSFFSKEIISFVRRSMRRNKLERASLKSLQNHEFPARYAETPMDLAWIKKTLDYPIPYSRYTIWPDHKDTTVYAERVKKNSI